MTSALSIAVFAVVISVAVDQVSGAQPDMDCKQMMGEMTKKQMGGIQACTKKLGYKGKEKSQKMNCILRCVMQQEKILNDDGFMPKEYFEQFLEDNAPGNLKDNIRNTLGKCQEQHSEKIKAIADDPMCKSYDPLIKCFMNSIMALCPK